MQEVLGDDGAPVRDGCVDKVRVHRIEFQPPAMEGATEKEKTPAKRQRRGKKTRGSTGIPPRNNNKPTHHGRQRAADIKTEKREEEKKKLPAPPKPKQMILHKKKHTHTHTRHFFRLV